MYQIEIQANNGVFIEIKLHSSQSNNFKYFVYVLIDESKTGLQAIIAHACGCEVGERVAGCWLLFSRGNEISWYFGSARVQTSTDTSAEFPKNYFVDGSIHIQRK